MNPTQRPAATAVPGVPAPAPAPVLVLEGSGPLARLALRDARGRDHLEEVPRDGRYDAPLVPAAAALLARHGLGPAELAGVGLTLGPGGFTGLRLAAAAAKTLAWLNRTPLLGVPSLELYRAQHPADVVALAIKQGAAWSAGPGLEPGLRPLPELVAHAAGLSDGAVVRADATARTPAADGLCQAALEPDARALLQLVVAGLAAGRRSDPVTLEPLYVRETEAERLWRERRA